VEPTPAASFRHQQARDWWLRSPAAVSSFCIRFCIMRTRLAESSVMACLIVFIADEPTRSGSPGKARGDAVRGELESPEAIPRWVLVRFDSPTAVDCHGAEVNR
jgi:hypothetical protein